MIDPTAVADAAKRFIQGVYDSADPIDVNGKAKPEAIAAAAEADRALDVLIPAARYWGIDDAPLVAYRHRAGPSTRDAAVRVAAVLRTRTEVEDGITGELREASLLASVLAKRIPGLGSRSLFAAEVGQLIRNVGNAVDVSLEVTRFVASSTGAAVRGERTL